MSIDRQPPPRTPLSQGGQNPRSPQQVPQHVPASQTGRPRWTAWLLRLLLTTHAAIVVAQPVLIGRYLDGDFDRLATHSLNGSLLPGVAMLCIGAALCHWLIGRGRFWPVPATVLLVPAEGMQIGAGHARQLAVHIPLGTAIVAIALFLAAWSWTSRVHHIRLRSAQPGRPA